jgi:hypothetical protein
VETKNDRAPCTDRFVSWALPKLVGVGVETALATIPVGQRTPSVLWYQDGRGNESDCLTSGKTNSARKCNGRSLRDSAAFPSWQRWGQVVANDVE